MVLVLLTKQKENMDYLRKSPDVETQTIETRNTSPLTQSGHVMVSITPRYFLDTVLIRAIHHFELTCHLVVLFCNQSIRTCYDNKT